MSQFILTSYLSLVNLLKFFINCLQATSCLSQCGIGIKITLGLTTKKPDGMVKSIYLDYFIYSENH